MFHLLKLFLILLTIGFLGWGFSIIAQQRTPPAEPPDIFNADLDEDIQAEDLEVGDPQLLPDNPFYFLKNWARGIQSFFAFNPLAKAELKMRFANEKLMEAKKTIEEKKDPEVVNKALENYEEEVGRIKSEAEKIKEKVKENPSVGAFLDKFIHQQTLHQKLLQKLEAQVPEEALEKIRTVRERHLERFNEVMLKLEDRKEKITEKLTDILERQKGSRFKHFKNLEVLLDLEEKSPEDAKEAIRKAQGNSLKRLRDNLVQMPPADQERFKEYIERISGEKETHLEILENLRSGIQATPETPSIIELKEKLEQSRISVLENVKEKLEKTEIPLCPRFVWIDPGPCEEGRIIFEKDSQGCPLAPRCVILGERELPTHRTRPLPPGIPGEEETGEAEAGEGEILPPETIAPLPPETVPQPPETIPRFCITLWDPVCGKNGKTYSNECFAKIAGIEVDHEDICEERIQERLEILREKLEL